MALSHSLLHVFISLNEIMLEFQVFHYASIESQADIKITLLRRLQEHELEWWKLQEQRRRQWKIRVYLEEGTNSRRVSGSCLWPGPFHNTAQIGWHWFWWRPHYTMIWELSMSSESTWRLTFEERQRCMTWQLGCPLFRTRTHSPEGSHTGRTDEPQGSTLLHWEWWFNMSWEAKCLALRES